MPQDRKTEYPPGGTLFANDRRTSDKAPDVTGKLEISADLLRYLNGEYDRGRPIEMRLAGWRKKLKSKAGTFYSLTASEPMVGEGGKDRPVSRTASTDEDTIPF